jgi:hypothetical protein
MMSELRPDILLTREALYGKVWSTPATQLAKQRGISDVAIGKICKKLNVPQPPVGYWQRLRFGRSINILPLPDLVPGGEAVVTISPNASKRSFGPRSPEVLRQVAEEGKPENRIEVGNNLQNPHLLVRQTKRSLEGGGVDQYGRLWARRNQPCLDICVTPSTLDRALRIMDSLLKALEARKLEVKITNEGRADTRILICEEKLKVRLIERVDRTERVLSVEEKYSWRSRRWEFSSSGNLSFEVEEYWTNGCQKKWADGPGRRLEDQLNQVIIGLFTIAEAVRLERITREQDEERRRDEERHRQKAECEKRAELECVNAFDQQCDFWVRSQNVRKFLQACEKSLVERFGPIPPGSPEDLWLM